MKPIRKLYGAGLALAGMMLFNACEKAESRADFGTPVIYMPQATFSNLRYPVPNTGTGLDSATVNYKLTSDSLLVILGVTASGKKGSDGYTVQVSADADTAAALISSGVFPVASTEVLPGNLYALPGSVRVPAGASGGVFYLAVHREQLKAYAGKTLLLGVEINNASAYSLHPVLSRLLVVIRVDGLPL